VGPTVIIVVLSVFALVFAGFAVMMVAAALGRRHHHEKNGRERKR
jgi:hypothetical protein